MATSLIESLPKIVSEGKREVKRIKDRLQGSHKITLQTNEYVLSVRNNENLFKGEYREIDGKNWFNKLIYGDNLLVLQALLSGENIVGGGSRQD